MKYFAFISISICFLVGCGVANSGQIPLEEEISIIENSLTLPVVAKGSENKKFYLLNRMAKYNVPGVSVAVVKDGKIHWSKGYGIANTETESKVDTNTLFQAGSISKPLAALAALKLAQEGKVDLDEDVNSYLKEWKIPESELTKNQKVTLRLLLTHSAGLSIHGFPGYSQTDTFPTDIQVLRGEGNTGPVELYMKPDSIFRYSGGGYTVMEQVIQDVSGLPIDEYLALILSEMNMTNSTFAQPLPKNLHNQASAAYTSHGDLYEGLWHNYPEQAAAGLWTTPEDLAKYYIHVQGVIAGNEDGVLSKSTFLEMLTPHKNNWGLGPALKNAGDSLHFGHGGKNAGFTNEMTGAAFGDYTVIVMTNADNGGKINAELTQAISAYYGWNIRKPREVEVITLDDADLNQLVGSYKFIEQVDGIGDYLVEITKYETKLVVNDPNNGEIDTLTSMSPTEFIVFQTGDEVEFQVSSDSTGFIWNETFQFYKVE